MINVIWIDDHCMDAYGNLTPLGAAMCDQAYDMNIDIMPFSDYKPALKVLMENPRKWNAIILDVQNENKETGGITDDFHLMKNKIKELQIQNGSMEPYVFVFSGIDQYQNSELMPKEDYASRSVYAKPTESDLLFQDIERIVNVSPFYQVKNEHIDALNGVESMGWGAPIYNELLRIIYSIEIQKENKSASLLNDMRKIVEGPVLGRLQTKGFFPEDCDTLNKRSVFIGKADKERVPVYVQRALHSIVEITNNASHISDGSVAKSHLRTAIDVTEGNAPYVLRSCLYDLLTLILWVSKF